MWYVAPCGARPRSVAILLHERWCRSGSNPKFKSFDGRLAQLDVQIHGVRLRLLSSHLPHSDWPDAEYDAALACLESAVDGARACRRHIVVGIDANAVLASSTHMTPSALLDSGACIHGMSGESPLLLGCTWSTLPYVTRCLRNHTPNNGLTKCGALDRSDRSTTF